MPSRNKEAFEWIKKARELWPPDINKILECYKKAEEISPDYYLIYKDKARLFHGLERFDEAVVNYDLEIKKQRERYKNTGTEKFETDEEREEFERGQVVMEDMFGRMKQVRDKAAQKIETEVTYPWEDQILYFSINGEKILLSKQLSDLDESAKVLFLGLINIIKNYLEKTSHPRDSYHDLAASNGALLNEIIDWDQEDIKEKIENDPEMIDLIKKTQTEAMKKFEEWEKNKIGNFKFSVNETEILDMFYSKTLEKLTPIIQNLLEKKLLKTDHKN